MGTNVSVPEALSRRLESICLRRASPRLTRKRGRAECGGHREQRATAGRSATAQQPRSRLPLTRFSATKAFESMWVDKHERAPIRIGSAAPNDESPNPKRGRRGECAARGPVHGGRWTGPDRGERRAQALLCSRRQRCSRLYSPRSLSELLRHLSCANLTRNTRGSAANRHRRRSRGRWLVIRAIGELGIVVNARRSSVGAQRAADGVGRISASLAS
jgi:hypothetical protein